MIYEWRAPGRTFSLDAQVAGEELERIRVRNNGRLDSRNVVEEARPLTSPLHPAFEWDDGKAADAHRAWQARSLIAAVTIRVDRLDATDAPVRAFVSVQREADRSYTSTLHALSDTALRAQVLDAAWKELEAWRQRHAELVELAKVFAVIDQARDA